MPRRGLEQQMVVLARRAAFGAPAPRHAEVEDHMVVAVGRDDAISGRGATRPVTAAPVSRCARSAERAGAGRGGRWVTAVSRWPFEERREGRGRWFRLRGVRAYRASGYAPFARAARPR